MKKLIILLLFFLNATSVYDMVYITPHDDIISYDKKFILKVEGIKDIKEPGLYRLNKEGKAVGHPIWRMNFRESDFYLGKDNESVVASDAWASGLEGVAVSFYRKGELVKRYKISDLLKDYSCTTHGSDRFYWRKREGLGRSNDDFNIESGEYHISTCDGGEFTFDIYTGKIKEPKGLIQRIKAWFRRL